MNEPVNHYWDVDQCRWVVCVSAPAREVSEVPAPREPAPSEVEVRLPA